MIRVQLFLLFTYFIFGCAGSVLLHGLFLVAAGGGYSPIVVCGPLIAVASVEEPQALGFAGFSSCGTQG